MRCILWFALLAPLAAAQTLSLSPDRSAVRVEQWTPRDEPEGGWGEWLRVYVGAGDVPPMLGSYSVTGGVLVFRPRFLPPAGVPLRAVFAPPSWLRVERTFHSAAEKRNATTIVEQVYPSGDLVPENLLRFYVHFSAPMQRGEVWRYLQLLREDGTAVELPFLEIDQELWDQENRRFTILFDPGRIKRGVLPLTEAGPAIEAGHRYTLVISREWRDAQGDPLKADYRKIFAVTAAERRAVEPAAWRLIPPRPGTRDALVVAFDRPLDHALAQRLIRVRGLAGKASLAEQETRWSFIPEKPWPEGGGTLEIDTILEDTAGNRVGRPFDVDVFAPVTQAIRTNTVTLRW